jgi:hypothetical protein
MFNNAIVDIAIGLVLMYLVLSLMGTVINEYVATVLKLRASTLKSAITSIIDNENLRNDFYNNGVVDGTSKALGTHPSYLSGQAFAMAIVGSVDQTKSLPTFDDVKAAVQALPDCNIRDVLLAQITKANGNLDALHKGIADYFDSAMDRISGIYKRYLKRITLGVGIVIVFALNADSIKVGVALWSDSSLRAQIVQTANDFQKNNKPATPAPADNATVTGESTVAFAKKLENLDSTVRPLPIGWKASDLVSPWSSAGISFWLLKIIGLAITALAMTLGAPFWFDTLSKFMNVRGSGQKPDPTPPSNPAPKTA